MALPSELAPLLRLVGERRARHERDAIARLVAGARDGHPGCWIDQLGELCVLALYGAPSIDAEREREALAGALNGIGLEHWIWKQRNAAGSYTYLHSSPSLREQRFMAREGELRFEIRCDPKDDFGVFPDAAAARALVGSLARGLRVLNLFSYTGGFALAALRGGATQVTNVDASKAMLTWSKRNAELNGVDFAVVPDTAQRYLRRLEERKAAGKEKHFDLIILDPPAFGVGRGDERILRKAWPEMLRCVAALEPAHVLLAFNDFAYRRCEPIDALVEQHFARGWELRWLDEAGSSLRDRRLLASSVDPYYAPPVFAHLATSGARPRFPGP
ncbi:MAG: class I SAM-dependent methyltransferase [Planctomycetes bacterium]|nr:class I SAM-dependent methyltransferase [Planctomycetota bacterium]